MHLYAQKMGLAKDRIRKVFAVGKLRSGTTSWRYHVTTAIRDGAGLWWAVDPIAGRPMKIEDWYAAIREKYDPQLSMRLFSTPARQISPNLDSQLGRGSQSRCFDPPTSEFYEELIAAIFKSNTGKDLDFAKVDGATMSSIIKYLGLTGVGLFAADEIYSHLSNSKETEI